MSNTIRKVNKGNATTKAMIASVPGIRYIRNNSALTVIIRRENKRQANRARRRQAI